MRYAWHGYIFHDKDKIHKKFRNHIVKRALLSVWGKIKTRLCKNIPQCCSPHEAFFGKEGIGKPNWLYYSDLLTINPEGEAVIKSQAELRETGITCHWYLHRQLYERWKIDKKLKGIETQKTQWEEIMLKGKTKLISRYYKMLQEWDTEEEVVRHTMVKWAQNVGHNLKYENWVKIWSKDLKYTTSQQIKENIYKMVYRWHLTPRKLSYMYKNVNPICWKCRKETGSYFHMWWTCKLARQYWIGIYKCLRIDLKLEIPFTPEVFLLGMVDNELMKLNGRFIFYALACARITYAKFWKNTKIPSLEKWIIKLYETAEMDRLTAWMKDKTEEEVQTHWNFFYKFLKIKWKCIL